MTDRLDGERTSGGRWDVGVTALMVLGWACVVAAPRVGGYMETRRLAALQTEMRGWAAPTNQVRTLRNQVNRLREAADHRDSALECWRQVACVLPQNVSLSSFSYRQGEGFKLSGASSTVDGIHRFKELLDESALVERSTLSEFPVVPGGERLFDIEAELLGGLR